MAKLKATREGRNLKLGLHSLRSGGATTTAIAGVDAMTIKRHGRWMADAAMNRYVADSIDNKLKISRSLNL